MKNKVGDKVDRRAGSKNRDRLWWLALIFLPALVLRGPMLLGRAWGNGGMMYLVRAVASAPDIAAPETAQAARLLQRAVVHVPEAQSVWRGLGYALSAQGREDEAITAWKTAGETAQGLIWRGERARKANQYQEALAWYARAANLEPDLGDPWYYMGVAYEGMGHWEKALAAFQQGLSMPLPEIGQSDIFFEVGWLQFRKIEPPDLDAALAAFDAAVAQDHFSRDAAALEAHYQRGEVLRQLGLDEEALLEFEWVVAQQVEEHWTYYYAHVHVGVLYWQLEQDAERAESILMTAIVLRPDLPAAYLRLGRLYQNSGRMADAIQVYRQVLSFDPQNKLALEQLDKLTALDEN